MGEFISSKNVITRKEHECLTCERIMPKGTSMLASVNKDEGEIYTIYVCEPCQQIVHEFTAQFEGSEWLYEGGNVREGLSPGQTPEQLLEELRERKRQIVQP